MKKAQRTALGLKRALELLRQSDHRLLLMFDQRSPTGKLYYIVPGGYIERGDAEKIIARPDVHPFDDGLFPGCEQSWKLGPCQTTTTIPTTT